MGNLQALRERRANLWSQMSEIVERQSDEPWSGEDQQKYDNLEADLDTLEEQIQRQERHEERAARYKRVDRSGISGGREVPDDERPLEERYGEVFDQWLRTGTKRMSAEQMDLLQEGWKEVEGRALGVATNTAGGYTVPTEFRNTLVEAQKQLSSVRASSTVISTDTGATLPWPTVDDTANVGAIVGENTQITEQDVAFGQASIGAYMYTSKIVRVSFQLLNDTGFNLEAFLRRILALRIARIQNQHFTTGTGTGQPQGLVTAAVTGKTGAAGQVATVTYNDFIDLIDSVDPAYLGGGGEFMMSQTARRLIRKLTDSQNRPLWEPSLQAGVPDSFLGYGIRLNNDMPAPAASAKSILFGDFNEAYLVRDVNDFTLLRLEERYADFLQVGFLGFQRTDGMAQNTAAYRAYQHPAA